MSQHLDSERLTAYVLHEKEALGAACMVRKGVNWASHNFLALLKDALGGKQCSVEGHQWAQGKG